MSTLKTENICNLAAKSPPNMAIVTDEHTLADQWMGWLAPCATELTHFDSIDEFIECTAHDHPSVVLAHAGGSAAETLLSCLKRAKQIDAQQVQILVVEPLCHQLFLDGYRGGVDMVLPLTIGEHELREAVNCSYARSLDITHARIPISLDPQTKLLRYGEGIPVRLTDFELAVMRAFLLSPQGRLETWQLLDIADRTGKSIEKPALEVLLTRLRKKLRDLGAPCDCIRSIRGWGYSLKQ